MYKPFLKRDTSLSRKGYSFIGTTSSSLFQSADKGSL